MHEQDLRTLWVLSRVDALGSFAAAGRELGLTRAAISRLVQQSEARLGVRLAQRSTRQVVLSERARALVAAAQPALATLAAAVAGLAEAEGALRGPLRIGCSHSFGRQVLLPALLPWLHAHPQVQLALQLSDALEDPIARQLDLTLRIGSLPDSSLVARPVGRVETVLVGTPSLLHSRPAPTDLAELREWPAIAIRPPSVRGPRPWRLQVEGREESMALDAPVAEVNDLEAAAALARAGVGLAMLPRYLVAEDLREGWLAALPGITPAAGPPVHLCTPQRDLLPARVQQAIAHLLPALRERLAAPLSAPRRPKTPAAAPSAPSRCTRP